MAEPHELRPTACLTPMYLAKVAFKGCHGGFLGLWLIAVHHACAHRFYSEVNAGLRNGFERFVVKINNARATFGHKFS